MKSFKEYLIESEQTYDFKVKIAGECPEKCSEEIKLALSEFDCASCSSGNKTPIQETHYDFPEHKNIEITSFDVSLKYPATSTQVRSLVANRLTKTESCVIVRNPLEEAESILNHANDSKSGEALLGADYAKENHQNLVGEKQTMSLLKELNKVKNQGTPVKGVNEKLLAKKAPAEKTIKAEKQPASKSPISGKGK